MINKELLELKAQNTPSALWEAIKRYNAEEPMKDKPLELFKPEHFKQFVNINGPIGEPTLADTIADVANHALPEMFTEGYVDYVNKDGCPSGITLSEYGYDTHRILYHLEEIKEEEPECACVKLKPFIKVLKDVGIDCDKYFIDECFKCGTKLNE